MENGKAIDLVNPYSSNHPLRECPSEPNRKCFKNIRQEVCRCRLQNYWDFTPGPGYTCDARAIMIALWQTFTIEFNIHYIAKQSQGNNHNQFHAVKGASHMLPTSVTVVDLWSLKTLKRHHHQPKTEVSVAQTIDLCTNNFKKKKKLIFLFRLNQPSEVQVR